jgi:hypothetical protein
LQARRETRLKRVTFDSGFQVSRSIPGLHRGYEYQFVTIFDAAALRPM